MAAPKKVDEQEVQEDWLTTYADAITLLMAFFVMMASISKVDMPLYEKVAAGISNKIGKRDEQSPTQVLKVDVQDVVYNMQADQVVEVGTDDKGVVIELASSAFYRPGSAEIRPEALPVLEKIAETLNSPRYGRYTIEIEGHTDDDPISTPTFPSNWELSAGRATRVARYLFTQGMDPTRLKASGLAETRPKVPNRDASGAPIRENQAKNRRVLVRVYPMSFEEQMQRSREVKVQDIAKEKGPAAAAPPATARPSPPPLADPARPPAPAPAR